MTSARRISCALALATVLAAPGAPAQLRALAPLPAPLQDDVTWALAVQYEQYLLYLSVAASRTAPTADYGQYFTNGAAMTSVPSAGQPGSEYFTHGASATSVPSPGQPGSAYFTNGAEATILPLTAPAAQAPVPPPPEPPPSSAWWTPETPEPTPAPSTVPALAAEGTVVHDVWVDGPPMSFADWLLSAEAAAGTNEVRTAPSASVSKEIVEEPSAAANDSRARATFAPREKPREPVVGRTRTLAARVAGAFLLGVLLGALLMRRAPRRTTSTRAGL